MAGGGDGADGSAGSQGLLLLVLGEHAGEVVLVLLKGHLGKRIRKTRMRLC